MFSAFGVPHGPGWNTSTNVESFWGYPLEKGTEKFMLSTWWSCLHPERSTWSRVSRQKAVLQRRCHSIFVSASGSSYAMFVTEQWQDFVRLFTQKPVPYLSKHDPRSDVYLLVLCWICSKSADLRSLLRNTLGTEQDFLSLSSELGRRLQK